jgi:GT2 family glycosyltransferase
VNGSDMDYYRVQTLAMQNFPCEVIRGKKPFVFACNVNAGIRHALRETEAHPNADPRCVGVPDGLVLLNDDALLETPGGFSVMAQACREHPEYGLIGATTKIVGNPNQFPKGIGLRDENRMVCFFCVYIPRTTIDRVGLLDPRFVDYGMDDDDYSFEVRKAGLKIGVHDGCYVDHGSLKSSFRGDPKTPADFRPNLKRFIEKWGHDNWGRPV